MDNANNTPTTKKQKETDMPYGHNRKIHGRNLIVYSTNTESHKTIDQLNEDDWQLFTPDVVNKKGYTNDHAVREINQAVVDGLATWNGRSATLEDAQKIATPVYASFEKWRDHGADDTEPHAEFTGILLSIGFSEDTICG